MFEKRNIQLLLAGVGLLAIGYLLLGYGPVDNPLSLSVAPVIIVLVYCVVVPLAIIVRPRGEGEKEQKEKGV